MYKRDCAAIQYHAQSHAEGLLDVIAFTLCTIQTPLKRCLDQVQDIRAVGAASVALWGAKREGYEYATANLSQLYADMSDAMARGDDVKAMLTMLQVPCLGLVKAGFVCQMFGFDIACLDTHNLKALGMAAKDVKLDAKLSLDKRVAKVQSYITLTRAKGGAEKFWNEWCHYVAAKGGLNKGLDTGDVVSAYHVKCVVR